MASTAMPTRVVVLLISACGAFFAAAAASHLLIPSTANDVHGTAAGLACESPVHDFGNVTSLSSEQLTHVFRLHNTGSKPVKIIKQISSCGCAAANVPVEPILPGNSCEIRAGVRWNGLQGPQEAKILLVTDDLRAPNIVLALRGLLDRPASVSPAMINFGRVERVEHRRIVEVFAPANAANWAIIGVEVGSPLLAVQRLNEDGEPDGSRPLPGPPGRFVIILAGSRVNGEGASELIFQTNEAPLRLYVRWQSAREAALPSVSDSLKDFL